MITLENLLQIDGVLLASEFSLDGKLISSKMNKEISQNLIDKKAQLCATVTMMFNALADSYSKLSDMNWLPQKCWMYSGGDWIVFVSGLKAVFIEKEKADLNQLYQLFLNKH